MNKYCCFFCPAKDYAEKELTDRCPTCGRPYGFVMTNPPTSIREYRVLRALGRGFYGAAYVGERTRFNKKFVLKISPIEFYQYFSKTPFEKETDLHSTLASEAEHIVGIDDAFEQDIVFSDEQSSTVPCYVTVLDFVDGDLLRDYVYGAVHVGAAGICQIAIDLLRIRAEFQAHKLNHNDLHAENLIVERLSLSARRHQAVDEGIKVMAIDLGSISDDSKSSTARHGDLYFIATHIDCLLDRLLSSPEDVDDRDYRVALALQAIVHGLLADAQNLRLPNPTDLVGQIEQAYYRASHPWRPWSTPLELRGFSDHYNAQTLVSWDVPRLLVDPDHRWLQEVTRPGPQIITGMRGCGKTMLLRALDIHARLARADGEAEKDAIDRATHDQFVGLFISAQRLLDLRHSVHKLEHRLTRLYVHYSLQAARALLHLRDLDSSSLAPAAHALLASGISDYLHGSDDLRNASSIEDLERRLERIAVLTSRGGDAYTVREAPAQAFPHLAERFRSCSPVFASSTIFFLLDDVSTRYLEIDRIAELLSALLFQSPSCAFKFTSEWQTIELGLQSPGRIHPISVDRDVSVFDLGADVFQTINGSGKEQGNDFVAQILQQRAKFHASHPTSNPRELLGDVSLEQVAREIAGSEATSRDRKQAYRGLTCLTNVCVGDIGDVIKLYEEIIRRAFARTKRVPLPISASIQADCFQEISARRLYDLNRRGGYFKNHALAFAEAAHELLVRSHREAMKHGRSAPRLRQYSSIYVRVTSDDRDSLARQLDQLHQLIDAGVFVYSGGAPRSKTKDSNPIQQFKLSYRKICGLASFIGLADRDRFELSGKDLEEWLTTGDKGVLLRNQIKTEVEGRAANESDTEEAVQAAVPGVAAATPADAPRQCQLFAEEIVANPSETNREPGQSPKGIDVSVIELSVAELSRIALGGIVTGLGFEDRTLASNRLLAESVATEIVHAVRYGEPGFADEIVHAWTKAGRRIVEHQYAGSAPALPRIEGLALIDVSGLSKPVIFASIRRELIEKGRVLVCHVSAERHYPLQEDLRDLFAAKIAQDPIKFLESLGSVLKGESGPYTEVQLLDGQYDLTRNRALLAFASAKHERLFSLLDKREYDYIEVIAPTGDEPRSRVANYAAEFLCQSFPNAKVERINTSDLVALIRYLDGQYLEVYGVDGANLEIGLTGSKMQAVASAVLSARRKVAQAWYLSPAKFDVLRFSKGVGDARIFDISAPARGVKGLDV
jgi:hypothetical protein